MLTLVLAEAELEPVPDQIARHPVVRAAQPRRIARGAKPILDAAEHYRALQEIPDGARRGRPDLAHLFLLLGLDSLLNKRGGLRLVVHTRNDEVVRVAPETRLMRNYPRFLGLMEQLFEGGQVPPAPAPALLTLEPGWPLGRVLREEARGPVVALDEKGRRVAPRPWLRERALAAPDLTLVLGGFAKGDFRADLAALASDVVGFGEEALSVWTIECEAISGWEDAVGVFA